MNPLNLQSRQISLELPGTALECDVDRRQGTAHDDYEHDNALSAARGILIALGLSACMWLIVLAAVAFF